jgi:hypothetical protein
MILKNSVKLGGVRAETVIGMIVVSAVYAAHGLRLRVTSVKDGKHQDGSLHYAGLAFDAGVRDVPAALLAQLLTECKRSLSPQWDIVAERDHIHFEFDPKN